MTSAARKALVLPMAKNDAADKVLAAVRGTLGKDAQEAIMRLGDKPLAKVDAVSTGSPSLDHALGCGGLPRGRIVEAYGPEACLDSETLVHYEVRQRDGSRVNHKGGTMERLYERFHGVRNRIGRPTEDGDFEFFAPSVNEEGRVLQNRVVDVVCTGERECFEVETASGARLVATADHKFYTGEAFVPLSELRVGSRVMLHNSTPFRVEAAAEPGERLHWFVKNHPVAGEKVVRDRARGYEYTYKRLARSRAVVEAAMNDLTQAEYRRRLDAGELGGLVFLTREQHVHHLNEVCNDDRLENLVVMDASAHVREHALERHNNLRYVVVPDEVIGVRPVGKRRTYDLRMESPYNNYVAGGLVVHNSGKTTLFLHTVAEAQKRGLVCAFVDAEHALDTSYARRLGVNTDDLLLSQPDCGEQALEVTEALVRAGVGVVVVDSVAALVPRSEIEGDMGDHQMGAHARLMSQAMRKLTAVTFHHQSLVCFVNQIRMKIGVMFGSPETTTGGNALKFYASVRLDVRRVKTLRAGGSEGEDGKGEALGSRTRVKIVKNKLAPPFREVEFNIMYGRGIDRALDVFELADSQGLLEKSGSWYSYKGEKLGNGRPAACAAIAGTPAGAALEADVRAKMQAQV